MKIADIKDVLTFAAFRPEPDDGSAPWIRRFPNRRTLLLNVGKNRTSWRGLGKGGQLGEGGTQRGDFKDIAASFAAEWRHLTDDGWCAVSLNSRYVISLESNLSRKEGIEDVIRTNPRAALGAKFERHRRYALINNPEHSTSVVLSCDEEVIRKIETTLAEVGLKVGRIACGPYTMLRRAIEHVNSAETPPPGTAANHLFVICCEGSVCLLNQSGDAWSELRSRSEIYDEDPSPVLELLGPTRRSDDPGNLEIVFVADHAGTDLPERISAHFAGHKFQDLTQPDHLWALLADLRSA